MKKLLTPKAQGAVRHLMTALGPLLAAHGVTTEAYWMLWVGIVAAGLGFAASWFAPEKK